MKQKLTLNDIAGYATEKMVWRLIMNLAERTESGNLTANDIIVTKEGFTLKKSDAQKNAATNYCAPETFQNKGSFKTEASEVWTLGALAYLLITGMNVFEGKGGASQNPSTHIPKIGSVYASETLSNMIRQCLNYSPEKRPSKELISRVAKENLGKTYKPRKRLTTHSGRSYATSLVKFWPEEMIPFLCTILFSLLPFSSFAQKNAFNQSDLPNEMKTLVMRCIDLRSAANTEKVKKAMARDMHWTMMDELPIDKLGECTTKQPVEMFGINDIGFSILKQQGGVTNSGGRFRDGRDPRYHYSFIEVTVRKNASVTYSISGREGKQIFAIVPFEKNARFSATIPNGQTFTENGVCYIQLKQPLKKAENFKLTIKNESGKNAAFVIINYNSRKNG